MGGGREVPVDFFLRPYLKFPGFPADIPKISVIVPSPDQKRFLYWAIAKTI
jgi:hypothetical protein